MKDKNERKHRRTSRHPACVEMMAGANFDAVPPLAEAMGLTECEHKNCPDIGTCPDCGVEFVYCHPGKKKIERLPNGRTRITYPNGVVMNYLPNGAAENVDYDND